MTRRIGLLGGSFNPAHKGHRHISLLALEALGLDEVWWLVSPGNPLKPVNGMAPLGQRCASAWAVAKHARIRVTAIESRLGTRYTADTLTALVRRFPAERFIWLMGADNLAQFHRWQHWRRIARTMPIAVIARPGYEEAARFAPAMGWFRRFVHPPGRAKDWTQWSLPALVLLRLPLDRSSATQLRATDPDWHLHIPTPVFRDAVTRRSVIPPPQ